MKPAAFDYVRVESADEAVSLLRQHGEDARILAGGQTLMSVLNMRMASPSLLIDISQSRSMNTLQRTGHALEIGASTTQSQVRSLSGLAQDLPLVAQALPWISHWQVRNRGTVCGSLAHADPSAELPLVLLALKGHVLLQGPEGQRRQEAGDFFTGVMNTSRQPDELLRSAHYPLAQPHTAYVFDEYSVRHGDFAACAVAAVVTPRSMRLAVGGVADRPTARDWPCLQGSALDDALHDFAWDLEARDDPQFSARARRHLVRSLGRRALQAAMDQLQTQTPD